MYHPHLKAFLCVAECGSFSKAAEKLFVSATAVMKQMNQLEAHLGLHLLERTNHGVVLTPAGESVCRDARFLVAYSEEALARARAIEGQTASILRVGTSILNPCGVFMDLWQKVSGQFPQYKVQIVPFEDDHRGILSVLDHMGQSIDFLAGVCDSAQWLRRCRFYPLGVYQKCVAVPLGHRLAQRECLTLRDLEGETLMMVRRGDSAVNDRIRDALERQHPAIRIEDTEPFYDISVYNRCVQQGNLLLNVECWKNVHPLLRTSPVDWAYTIPYGLLYAKEPPKRVCAVLRALDALGQAEKNGL